MALILIKSVHSSAFHTTAVDLSGDDILRQFWKIEEPPLSTPSLTMEERAVMQHFEATHHCNPEGRLVVSLYQRNRVLE